MPEIWTIDAQDSYYSGIIVVVTGSLSIIDDVTWKFTPTFFLPPQEKDYCVITMFLGVLRKVGSSG